MVYGVRTIWFPSLLTLHYMEVSQLHDPAAFPRGKFLRYPLIRRPGGPQNRAGHYTSYKSLVLASTRTTIPRRRAPSLVNVLTELSWLPVVCWFKSASFWTICSYSSLMALGPRPGSSLLYTLLALVNCRLSCRHTQLVSPKSWYLSTKPHHVECYNIAI